MHKLNATAILQDRIVTNPKIEVHTWKKVEAILGENYVEGIEVVSEETGVISIAENGKLIRDMDEIMLKKHLVGIIS